MMKSVPGRATHLLVVALLFLVAHASGAAVHFSGSVYNGLFEEELRAGGSTFQIHLSLPVFAGYDDARLRGFFSEVLALCYVLEINGTRRVPVASSNTWLEYFLLVIRKSSVEIFDNGRSARVTFHPCPECVVREVLVILPKLPLTVSPGQAVFDFGRSARTNFWSNAIILAPKPVIQMGTLRLGQGNQPLYITGRNIEIPLVVEETHDIESKLKVMEGLTCTNTRNAMTQGNAWDDDKLSYQFIATRGGMVTLCFALFPRHFPGLMMKIGESLRIAGPEGVWNEPQPIQSGVEFTGTLYGMDLSERDVLSITSRGCDEFPLDEAFFPWLSFPSSNRAYFFGVLEHEGVYYMCYRRDGSPMFVMISKVMVEKGDHAIIEGDLENAVVDKVTHLVNVTNIARLKVERMGKLVLDGESLNISSFVWSGGDIVGQGDINCMGVAIIRSQSNEPLRVSFILRNYGDMVMDVHQLNLEGEGAVHNFGNLTISISNGGAERINCVRSLGLSSVIVNHGGVIRVISENERLTLCQARILNMEGILLLVGKLLITDMSSMENTQLILGKGTHVVASDTRLRGEITLMENSELTVGRGCSLVSATVKGDGSRVVMAGDSILLEFLTVTGDVKVDIVGIDPEYMDTVIAIHGTNRFTEGTFLNLRCAHLITGIGLVKLLIEGVLSVEFDSVSFTGNILIQVDYVAIIYGKGSEYLPSKNEKNSLVSLVVKQNALLVALDMAMDTGLHAKRNMFFTFSNSVAFEGRVLLQGCWAIPLGGVIGGVVGHLDVYEDVVKIMSYLADAGVQVTIPMFSQRYASFILEGEFQLRDGAKLDLDEIIMRNAVVRGGGAVVIKVDGLVTIDRGSRFLMGHDSMLNASLMHLEGLLEAKSALKPLIYSDVEIFNGGGLRLYSSSFSRSPCLVTSVINGDVRRGSESRVECHAVPLIGEVDTQMNLRELERTDSMRRMIAGLPSGVECPQSYLLEESEKYFLLQYFLGNVRYDPPPNVPTPRNMLIAGVTFLFVGIMTLHLFLRVWGLTWREWYVDIRREPPLRLNLSYLDFTSHKANYCVLLAILFNALQVSMASFHPQLPLPIGFMSLLTLRSVHLIMSHHRFRSDLQLRLVSLGVILWGLAAIPLIFTSRRSAYVKRCSKNVRAILRMFSKIYYVLRLLALFFVVSIQSMVLDFLACNTFLADLPNCEASQGDAFMPLTATLTLTFMMPWANLLESKLLQCDLHFKASVLFTEHSAMMMEIAMWKVFYQSPIMILINNLVFEGMRVLLYSYCTPTAYKNINRLVFCVSLVPFTLTLCTLIHTVRVRLGLTYTCLDGEVYFAVVGLLLIVLIVVSLWCNLITVKVESGTTNNSAIDAISRSVEQIHNRVQELNCELLTCGSVEERESILNAITRLRAELLDKQKRYRYERYSYLSTFYFCKRHVSHGLEDSQIGSYTMSQGVLLGSLKLRGTSNSANTENNDDDLREEEVVGEEGVDERGFLSQDELEAFRCGPALGSGSYGAVHLGILRSGKLVAVKYVNIQNSSEEALSQVKLEVNMLKKLSHPNIVRYYGCCAAHGYMMIFMEFAVAGSLTSIAKSFSGSNESVIGLYTHQVLLGLRFLHGKGVVHRDIKGENILVDGFGVVKLADFGCSKVLAGIANHSHVGCDTLVGSPFWMAPEVIRNEPYGTKADIWSVGCTVVEMLNGGEPPWRDDFDNVFSVMYYVGLSDEIPSIPENTSDLCRDFLKKCFHRDTKKRPSADELLKHSWFQYLETNAKLLT